MTFHKRNVLIKKQLTQCLTNRLFSLIAAIVAIHSLMWLMCHIGRTHILLLRSVSLFWLIDQIRLTWRALLSKARLTWEIANHFSLTLLVIITLSLFLFHPNTHQIRRSINRIGLDLDLWPLLIRWTACVWVRPQVNNYNSSNRAVRRPLTWKSR